MNGLRKPFKKQSGINRKTMKTEEKLPHVNTKSQ